MFNNNDEVLYDGLSKEAIEKNEKVYAQFNPYFASDTQVEITSIEQVHIYHKKLKGSRILGELLKDKQISKRKRKRILKDLLKYWEIKFREETDLQKKTLIERTTKIKHRKVKRVGSLFIYLYGLTTIITILLSQRISYLSKMPLFKGLINNINGLLDDKLFYNLIIVTIYLSFISCLYLIVLKSYFDIMRKAGHNAENFINDEFKKLHKRYLRQHKTIKSHLIKYLCSKRFTRKYHLKKIYDLNLVITKLDSYGKFIESKNDSFRKKYLWLRLISILLQLVTLGVMFYLISIYKSTF